MEEYITFAQLADALRRCGKARTVDDCKGCAYYRGPNPELVTIISSERTIGELSQIDEAIAGRIAERAKAAGYCLSIKRDPARNWRLKGIEEV